MIALTAVLISAVVASFVVWMLARWRGRGAVLDQPGHRSLHSQPTPRLGGVGISVGVVCGLAWLGANRVPPPWPLIVVVPVLAVSLWEDLRPMRALPRFAVQLLACLLLSVAYTGVSIQWLPGVSGRLDWAGWIVLGLAAAWMTNLYNFMDGMDGLAGSMALTGFGSLGFACWQAGAEELAIQNWIVAAACAGFLPWNLPRARIFMGDAGAIPLGFLAAGLGLEAVARALVPVWFVLLLFSPFLIDASLTLLARLRRRERVWEAHRSHYYQRWVMRCSGRHGPVLLGEAALMLACSTSGIILLNSHSFAVQWAGLAGWGAVYAVLAVLMRHGIRDATKG